MKRHQIIFALFILFTLFGCGRAANLNNGSSNGQKVALVKSADGTFYNYYCLKGKAQEQMSDCVVDAAAVASTQSSRGFLGGGDALTQYLLFNLLGYPQQQVCGFLWNNSNCYQNYFQYDPYALQQAPPLQTCSTLVPPVIARFDPFAVAIQSKIRHVTGCYSEAPSLIAPTVAIYRLHRDDSDGTRDYIFSDLARFQGASYQSLYMDSILDGIRFRLYPSAQGAFTVPIYSCLSPMSPKPKHFLSKDANCEGKTRDQVQLQLGFMAPTPQSNAIALHRWYNPRTGAHQDVIWQYVPSDAAAAGWTDEGIQGYVPQY